MGISQGLENLMAKTHFPNYISFFCMEFIFWIQDWRVDAKWNSDVLNCPELDIINSGTLLLLFSMEQSKAKHTYDSSTRSTMPSCKAESQKQSVKCGAKVRPFKKTQDIYCDGCKFTLDSFTLTSITPYLWDCPFQEQLYWYQQVSEWACSSQEHWCWLGPQRGAWQLFNCYS